MATLKLTFADGDIAEIELKAGTQIQVTAPAKPGVGAAIEAAYAVEPLVAAEIVHDPAPVEAAAVETVEVAPEPPATEPAVEPAAGLAPDAEPAA